MTEVIPPKRPLAYTIKDTVTLTGLGKSTIFELLKKGTLRRRRVGRRVLIPAADIEALLGGVAPMSVSKLVPDPEVEAALRRLADIAQDCRFLAALLRRYPARSSLDKLGLRPVDFRYREALGVAVAREPRP